MCRALAFCSGDSSAASAAAAAGWGDVILQNNSAVLLKALSQTVSASAATAPPPPVSTMLDILSCIAPHSPVVGALVIPSLSSLLPLITSSPSRIRLPWLRLLISICETRHPAHCSSAARNGALLLPVQMAQDGLAEDILTALTAVHALAVSVLLPGGPAADDDEECLLCRTGALQAMTFVMRSSDDAAYLTLAASVQLLQCRHVRALLAPLSPPSQTLL